MLDLIVIFFEQLSLIWLKLFRQQQRNGREFLKSAIMTPLFIILFTAYVLFSSLNVYETPSTYAFHSLPPLATTSAWGIFNATANGQSINGFHSQRLYYSPNNHPGVQQLIGNLTTTYKSVVAIGCSDYNDMLNQYQSNLFNTWAYMEFNLNAQQLSTGKLVPNLTDQTQVDYTIMINPLQSSNFIAGSNSSLVYNDYTCNADAFWQSGYMTLQNYVSNYLALQYPNVSPNYRIETYIQRYPKSSQYNDQIQLSVGTARWSFFRWIGSTVLSVCIFVPILGILTEIVRERQYKMKDLLEISGLMNSAYYIAYFIFCQVVAQLSIWLPVIGLLSAIGIFNPARAPAYGALMTCYSLAMTAFSMGFGFIVFQSEYYALPIFILNTALAIAGDYLGIAYDMSVGAKMFVIFLAPPLGLSMGVIQIENYLYDFGGNMDFNFVNTQKNYPSLNAICGMLILSTVVYMFIVLGMPFDWIIPKNDNFVEAIATSKADEVKFPFDVEDVNDNSTSEERLLEVNQLSHIYPDGTHAVKDMSFNIKSGEVLSFLGANGAGKSTCMGMLCGTLDATFGDALVSGFSISTDRVKARRKLGIAMQQDILWNDISVQDHLYIFGSIRGVHGAKLREEVNLMIESLGFEEKRASLAGTLSGGQKRRLCVGLSMVGGNAVVYLDEPTAGLDPVSRRQLWELVQRNRKGRAILLTTHFMDEADVLGDRIAIVKEGRLRALGSADYLKKQFGLGYLLRMSLEEHADADVILRAVSDRIPFATLASHAGTELSIRLPRESVVQFATLFEYIESNRMPLKILSFGIETTTLEEVFMRIVNEDNELLVQNHEQANKMLGAFQEERKEYDSLLIEKDEKKAPFSPTQLDALLCRGTSTDNGLNLMLIFNQVQSIVNKRFCQFRRSKGQFVMGLLLPVLLSILIAVTIQAIPTTILGVQYDSYGFTYTPTFATPVAGASNETSVNYAKKAFGGNKAYKYIGTTYGQLYNSLYPSNVAVAYNNNDIYNFSVAYNASTPTDFAGAVSELLAAATSNVTNNRLVVSLQGTTLPANQFDDQLNYGILAGFVLSVLAGAIGAGLSIVVGGERVSLVKHQQLASGASKIAYWLANFIFDFAVLFTNVILFSIFMAGINPNNYTGFGNQFIVGSGTVWAFASIFRFYVVSFFVADIRMAQYLYFYGSLLSMYILADFWALATFVGAQGNIQSPAASITGLLFSIIDPTFGWFLVILFQDNFLGIITQSPGQNTFKISSYYLGGMFVGGVFYFLIFFLYLEGGYSYFFPTKFIAKLRVKRSNTTAAARDLAAEPTLRVIGGADPDVIAEREKVKQKYDSGEVDDSADAIFINSLQKVYYGRGTVPTKVAVKNVSASIGVGEVFGLLGANGAGKTTLLKMVSGLEAPTSGVAYINGYDVVDETSNAQRSMGLCPQFDTLIERMTVLENLLYFGQIKGLHNPELNNAVEAFMAAMNIKRYEKKLIMQLSGGNRRKVSLAVALLGAPPTVYLDEPSTGLDPVASRLMWRLLTKIASTKKTAMVLTTHNMLECEAVCTRICIMKLGEMVCLGDSQHLRSTHGTGFLLEMTLATPDIMDAAISFVATTFPGAQIVDKHATMVNLEIPRASITHLSAAFRALEEKKAALRIVDYALSQSTLEQVFLKQIRPNERDFENDEEQVSKTKTRKATSSDFFFGYLAWIVALLLPGFHHFYLGNFWRGLKYFCTANEVYAGWLLDFFELHVLIQKSVEEHGHSRGCRGLIPCCCCYCFPCCCIPPPSRYDEEEAVPHATIVSPNVVIEELPGKVEAPSRGLLHGNAV